ncbi:MAG TPA: hypothetical protein VGH16_07130 [Candidatus Binatia bacterium]|jgi:hypothetical protein
MSCIALDDFGDKDVSRVYLAGRLAEAKRVEEVLTDNSIDYAVEVEPYVATFAVLSFGEYGGAAFYVLSGQADFCRRILAEAGLTGGILQDE